MRIHHHVSDLLIAVTTVISIAPVFAADGQLEINQACANVGCFAGDGAGLPVSISSPGSYLLTGNLSTADVNATVIAVSGSSVTLDLNGFAVIGPVSCTGKPPVCSASGSGIGVSISSSRSVTVRNGTIRGFADGIRGASGSGPTH